MGEKDVNGRVSELIMPAGTPVTFRLTSATAMNSFVIPMDQMMQMRR
jgi:heme/copper-type cytochrome/quinol oxidase subunit 2